MNPYGWWIFGYQKFSEPIIRKCISIAKQWTDITKDKTLTPCIPDLRHSLQQRPDWGDLIELRQAAMVELERRSRRITVDAAFDDHGSAVIGEFKSWGGFHLFTMLDIEKKMRMGSLFPERLAIRAIRHQQQDKEVIRFVFATVLKETEGAGGTFQLGQLIVEVMDIPHLLSNHGLAAAEQLGTFEHLEEAVAQVRSFVTTGH